MPPSVAAVPGQSEEPRHWTVLSAAQVDSHAADDVAMSAQHVPVAHGVEGQAPLPLLEPELLPVPLLLVPLDDVPLDDVPLDDVPLEVPLLLVPLDVPDEVPLEEPPPSVPPPPPEDELLLHAIQTIAHATRAAVPNDAETVRREAMGNLRGRGIYPESRLVSAFDAEPAAQPTLTPNPLSRGERGLRGGKGRNHCSVMSSYSAHTGSLGEASSLTESVTV